MRLDIFLADNDYFSSRNQAREAIKRGVVLVNGKVENKPSREIVAKDDICVNEKVTFVSIGGFKLEKALQEFNADVSEKIFVDIGASTGGFTDCLLKRGSKKVYAVDVGENLLNAALANDSRVFVMDNRNARYLEKSDFPDEIDGVVVDCSFISLKLILPSVAKFLKKGDVYALIKPQFECGAKALGKSGILKDEKLRKAVVEDILQSAEKLGFSVKGISQTPFIEAKNVEYVVHLYRDIYG